MEITYKSGAAGALWKPTLLPVYLLFGEEDRLKEEILAAFRRRVVSEDYVDFDLEKLDAASVSADAILSAAGQAPFGSERRLVIVSGMEQWRDRAKQSEAERLAEGIARLSNTICLVLVAAAEHEEARRKTALTVKVDNAVKKGGAVVACRALHGEALLEWISARVRQEKKRIDPQAAELLVQTVGGEMRLLEHEVAKLVSYVGEAEIITSMDVGTVVASSPEDVMFATIDAIARRTPDRALTLLAELHRYDPKPQAVAGRLLVLLSRHFRMLWQAKFLAEKRVNPRNIRALTPDLAVELPVESSIVALAFKAGELMSQARAYTWRELSHAIELLLLCDLANKGGVTEESRMFGADPTQNLQLLVLELTGATARRSA